MAAYDVVVVGGGIGGLTVAALLSARGVNVCLLERQSQVGGCLGRVEFSGHDFEPGMGLYTSFGSDEIHARVFAELPVALPETSLVTTEYSVRLSDGTDVCLYQDDRFFDELARVFPECANEAREFYKKLKPAEKTRIGKLRALWTTSSDVDLSDLLNGTSLRFQEFIAAQLNAFLHSPVESCSFESAAVALALPRSRRYMINGGTATLAERLAESIKNSGSVVRLDTPVLRLAYDESGNALGVDLLSGETVTATRAIVSNMTIWDTYGKLVGLNRTPPEVKKALNAVQGTGAYLIYASLEDSAVKRLPSEHFLVTSRSRNDDQNGEFTFALGSGPTPTGKRAVTLKMRTEVDEWFTFQSSEEDLDHWDQKTLAQFWQRLHRTVPELGGDIEVVETANPRTFYDLTRRKLGMVLGVNASPGTALHQSFIPNLFLVGDTVTGGKSLSSVTESALLLVNRLTK